MRIKDWMMNLRLNYSIGRIRNWRKKGIGERRIGEDRQAHGRGARNENEGQGRCQEEGKGER